MQTIKETLVENGFKIISESISKIEFEYENQVHSVEIKSDNYYYFNEVKLAGNNWWTSRFIENKGWLEDEFKEYNKKG